MSFSEMRWWLESVSSSIILQSREMENKDFKKKLRTFVNEHKKFERFLGFFDSLLTGENVNIEKSLLRKAVEVYNELAKWSLFFAKQYEYYSVTQDYKLVETKINTARPILQTFNTLLVIPDTRVVGLMTIEEKEAILHNFCLKYEECMGKIFVKI